MWRWSLKEFNNSKVFIEYSSDADDIYENIEVCNPHSKEREVLIASNDMIDTILLWNFQIMTLP